MHTRYIEIDLLRTLAIILMIIFHIFFDLHAFYGLPIDPDTAPWLIVFGDIAKNLFLLLVGISFVISYDRQVQRGATRKDIRRKFIPRGLRIIGYGIIITIVTYLFDAQTYVRFGILHLIGVSILLLPFFVRIRWNTPVALICIALGPLVASQSVSTSLLLPFGLMYPGFMSIDYFPLFPWFGVVLIGLVVGRFVYIDHQWRRAKPYSPSQHWVRWLSFPGRHSLFLYLIHQPIIMFILWILYGYPHVLA